MAAIIKMLLSYHIISLNQR